MVIRTVLDRFREGRRLNNDELNELLERQPELHDQVLASLSDRYLTRRSLRQMIEQIPGLRGDLGRRLLESEPRVLDVLEVMQDVPELRELAIEAVRTGDFSPTQLLRVARRNPRLREAAITAALADDHSRERILEVVRRLPGSEAMILERLEALGVPDRDIQALVAAVPELSAEPVEEDDIDDWRTPAPRAAYAVPDRPEPPRLTDDVTEGLGDFEAEGASGASGLLPGHERRSSASEPSTRPGDAFEWDGEPDDGSGPEPPVAENPLTAPPPPTPPDPEDEPAARTSGGRPDPWRDTEPPPIDDVDRRWGRGRRP